MQILYRCQQEPIEPVKFSSGPCEKIDNLASISGKCLYHLVRHYQKLKEGLAIYCTASKFFWTLSKTSWSPTFLWVNRRASFSCLNKLRYLITKQSAGVLEGFRQFWRSFLVQSFASISFPPFIFLFIYWLYFLIYQRFLFPRSLFSYLLTFYLQKRFSKNLRNAHSSSRAIICFITGSRFQE